jgi:hypothetical protein
MRWCGLAHSQLGDFAAGGMLCAMGIMAALLERVGSVCPTA